MDQKMFQYEHPFLTVDGIILRVKNGCVEVLLTERNDEFGKWALPGGFVAIDKLAVDTLREKVLNKVHFSTFYAEQLKTYDALNRDPRYRVFSIAYLCLTNDIEASGNWFQVTGTGLQKTDVFLSFSDLSFDHGQMIQDALLRLKNKLWWSDIVRWLLPEKFRISEAQEVFSIIEGKKTDMFRRQMGNRIKEDGMVHTKGRPAALFRWNDEWSQKGD